MAEEAFEESELIRRASELKVNAAKAGDIEKPKITLDESLALSGEVYRLIKPLVESKRRQQVLEQELQSELSKLAVALSQQQQALNAVTAKLIELIQTKNVNAEKESHMLDKLNEIL